MTRRHATADPKAAAHQIEAFPRSLRVSEKDAAAGIAAKFATWVKLGELPQDAVLARFVGSDSGTKGSYVDEATGARMGDEVDEMETLCYLAVTSKPNRLYMIFSPQPSAPRS